MLLDITKQQCDQLLIQGRGTLQKTKQTKTPTTTTTANTHQHLNSSPKPINNNFNVFTHSQLIDLNIPHVIRNRQSKKFLPAVT